MKKIVIDTNILLSALIKDSITRHLIIALNVSFYYPEPSFDEILRNKQEILDKSKVAEESFNTTLLTLFRYINIVKKEDIEKYIRKADSVMGSIHKNDIIFIAAALSQDAAIWSNDKDFKRQKEIPVVTTQEIVKNWRTLSKM
jgi:predicted nucleic acid-binding protein